MIKIQHQLINYHQNCYTRDKYFNIKTHLTCFPLIINHPLIMGFAVTKPSCLSHHVLPLLFISGFPPHSTFWQTVKSSVDPCSCLSTTSNLTFLKRRQSRKKTQREVRWRTGCRQVPLASLLSQLLVETYWSLCSDVLHIPAHLSFDKWIVLFVNLLRNLFVSCFSQPCHIIHLTFYTSATSATIPLWSNSPLLTLFVQRIPGETFLCKSTSWNNAAFTERINFY